MATFLKSSETFFVEEIPLIEPCGVGEHSFFKVKRKNLSTNYIASNLKNFLKIKEQEIGYAGNKDKLSTAVQTFSIPKRLEDKALLFFSKFNLEVLEVKTHNEKLRMGQIKGNRFKVKIALDIEYEEKEIEKNLKKIEIKGFPNFFGPQRVKNEESFERGRSIFLKNLKKGRSMIIIVTILIVSMLAAAISAYFFRDLLNAVIASCMVSLIAAVLFLLLHAPDVAMAEASIGAALVTTVFVIAIRRTRRYEE